MREVTPQRISPNLTTPSILRQTSPGSAISILERKPRNRSKRERRIGDNINVAQESINDHVVTFLERVPSSE